MITKAEIKQETNPSTYIRGIRVYEEGKVFDLEIKEAEDAYGKPVREIRSTVLGSGRREYQVFLQISEEESEILDDFCECPAHEEYWGLCKHCVATLLAYLDYRNKEVRAREQKATEDRQQEGMELFLEKSRAVKGIKQAGKMPARKAGTVLKQKTSPGFSELLSCYSMREQAGSLPDGKKGLVRLTAYLECYDTNYLSVEFKIGTGRMYVLKSVSKMTAAIHNLERVSYGTQLSFLHCMDAFSEDCRAVVRFLMNYTEENGSCYRTSSGRYYSYTDDRTLRLKQQDIDDFFEALEGTHFYLNTWFDDGKIWTCQKGMPKYQVTIRKNGSGAEIQTMADHIVYGRRTVLMIGRNHVVFQAERKQAEEILDFLDFMYHRTSGSCIVSEEDLPAFTRDLLPVLEKHFLVEKKNLDLEQYLPPKAEFEIYLDSPQKDMITCELYSVYGNQKYNVFEDENGIWKLPGGRDRRTEREISQLVSALFGAYDPLRKQMVLQGEEEIFDFLTKGIDDLKKYGQIFVSDRLKSIQVVSAPKLSVGVSLSGNLLELHVESDRFPGKSLLPYYPDMTEKRNIIV